MQLTLVLPSSHPAMLKNRALHSEGHPPLLSTDQSYTAWVQEGDYCKLWNLPPHKTPLTNVALHCEYMALAWMIHYFFG